MTGLLIGHVVKYRKHGADYYHSVNYKRYTGSVQNTKFEAISYLIWSHLKCNSDQADQITNKILSQD